MKTEARVINLDSGAMGPPQGDKVGDVEGNCAACSVFNLTDVFSIIYLIMHCSFGF